MSLEVPVYGRLLRKLIRVSRNMRRSGATYRRRCMWWRLSCHTFDKMCLREGLVDRKDLI